jgi:DNA repair protein RadC
MRFEKDGSAKMKYQEKKLVNKEGKEVAWRHPGGKLRRLGPTSLTDAELLTVILGSGSSGRSAEEIAGEIISKYYSLPGLMGKSISELMIIKGLKEVKATQIAAVFEVARRIVKALERE